MKILKIIKIIKYMILGMFLFTNILLSNNIRVDDNFDEISKILYELKVVNNYIKYSDLVKSFSTQELSLRCSLLIDMEKLKT